MTNLSQFPITNRWPAQHPDRIQLYSLPTPNGIKISAALEEMGLEYEPHLVAFAENDQNTPEFLSLNPNNKIPAIIDPNGPNGEPLALFESGAILQYLAEKSGKLISKDPAEKWHTIQWLMFQVGGVGPMLGQIGFFHKFAGSKYEDKRPLERYVSEGKRLFNVMEKHLDGRDYFVGDSYSIADLSIWPWVRNINGSYGAGHLIGFENFPNINAWLARCAERPASKIGIETPAAKSPLALAG